MSESLRKHWPERLAEIYDHLLRQFQDDGRADADVLAEKACLCLATVGGGRQIYLPQAHHLRKALRDRRIWHTFNGRNTDQLAVQHQLSRKQIYEIVATERQREINERNYNLFE